MQVGINMQARIGCNHSRIFTRAMLYICASQVMVDANTTLKVCDVIAYDSDGKVVSLNAYKA